jgi:hypothetical protein
MTKIISLAIAGILWLLHELAWQIVGELLWEASAPVRRPFAAIVRSTRGPGVGAILFIGGGAGFVMGLAHLNEAVTIFQARLGLALFIGGAIFVLVGASVWRESRRFHRKTGSRRTAEYRP